MAPEPPITAATLPAIPGLELQAKIGEGGMGVVYRAVHMTLQRTVAVKVLRSVCEVTAGTAWLRESRTLAALSHPNVVTIYDAGQTDGHKYLVMEYLAGGSLRDRMVPGQPWPLAEVCPLVAQVAIALIYIHSQGLLHLDLKPENILYVDDTQIKLADFGVAQPHEEAGVHFAEQGFVGTMDYVAPEHRTGLMIDARFDVFALGTIIYELLTGQLPGRVYHPVSLLQPAVPRELDRLLQHALARDPNERFRSVADLQLAFLNATGSPPPSRRRVWLVPTLALMAVLMLTGLLYVVTQFAGEHPKPATAGGPLAEGLLRVLHVSDHAERDENFFDELVMPSPYPSIVMESIDPSKAGPPADVPLPQWPKHRSTMVLRGPQTWAFVQPLANRKLGRQILDHWDDLRQSAVPTEGNHVQTGNFTNACLSERQEANCWRRADVAAQRNDQRRITLEAAPGEPNNLTLSLRNLDPTLAPTVLGCYQSLLESLPKSTTCVLRYRAKSKLGRGTMSVGVGMPFAMPDEGNDDAAMRVLRRRVTKAPPHMLESNSKAVLYTVALRVRPTKDWQTYFVIWDSPPFLTQSLHRNLMIDVVATNEAEADHVWIDDVALYAWPWGNTP